MARTQLGSLVVDVRTNTAKFQAGMNNARTSLSRFTKSTSTAQKAVASLGAIGATLGVAGIIRGVIQTTREIEKLKATLGTLTGSQAGANNAFRFISDFASTTPFALQEVTSAFIKLKALGLDPSEDALRSYGNTASAMGKSLEQFIEAIADATTGEFERLKEFGIKSASEGDRVRFTFQGITTEVKKSSEDIEKFLRNIGKTTFSGALERQANTLDGVLSNIGDAFTRLLVAEDGSLNDLKSALSGFLSLLNDPANVQAAQALTGALIRGFSGVINTVTTATNVFQFLGESLAASVAGPIDLTRIDDQIARLQKRIEVAKTQIGPLFSTEQAQKAINEIQGQIDVLIEKRKLLDGSLFSNVQAPAALAPPVIDRDLALDLPDITLPKLKEQKLSPEMRKTIAELEGLFDSTRTAAERYEIQVARLQELSKTAGLDQDVYNRAINQYAQELRESDPVYQKFLEDQEKGLAIFDATRTNLESLQEEYKELDRLYASGAINLQTYQRAVVSAAESFDQLGKQGEEKLKALNTFADQAARNMQDAFADFLFDPFDQGLSGMLTGFLKVIQRIAAEQASAAIFGPQSDGGLGLGNLIQSGITGLFGFGGAKAIGGSVSPNKSFLVGERGPELFVPPTRGNIVPNDQIRGRGSVTVIQNISAPKPSQYRKAASRMALDAQRQFQRA